MSPSTPNRLFSNEVSGLEVDHRHIDRTVEVRSRLPETLLIAVNDFPHLPPSPGTPPAEPRVRPLVVPADHVQERHWLTIVAAPMSTS